LILFIVSIQFFSALIFKKPLLFNFFGKFQYSNIVNIDELTSGFLPRTQGFYLEPSYLAFVVITLIAMSMNLKKNVIFMFLIGGITILMSGSRGGFLGFFLLLTHHQFANFKLLSFKSIFLLLITTSFLFVFVLPVFSLLSLETLSTENSSQNVRFYQGYNLSYYVLSNFFSGIPFGSLSKAYLLSNGEESSIFSFFIFNVIYHGWFSFFLIFFIFHKILFANFHFQTRSILFIYVLLYFNMTGNILAPDTYFWFVCFYYTYRISKLPTNNFSNESFII
jgi:putative colanic acid polymerase